MPTETPNHKKLAGQVIKGATGEDSREFRDQALEPATVTMEDPIETEDPIEEEIRDIQDSMNRLQWDELNQRSYLPL